MNRRVGEKRGAGYYEREGQRYDMSTPQKIEDGTVIGSSPNFTHVFLRDLAPEYAAMIRSHGALVEACEKAKPLVDACAKQVICPTDNLWRQAADAINAALAGTKEGT